MIPATTPTISFRTIHGWGFVGLACRAFASAAAVWMVPMQDLAPPGCFPLKSRFKVMSRRNDASRKTTTSTPSAMGLVPYNFHVTSLIPDDGSRNLLNETPTIGSFKRLTPKGQIATYLIMAKLLKIKAQLLSLPRMYEFHHNGRALTA